MAGEGTERRGGNCLNCELSLIALVVLFRTGKRLFLREAHGLRGSLSDHPGQTAPQISLEGPEARIWRDSPGERVGPPGAVPALPTPAGCFLLQRSRSDCQAKYRMPHVYVIFR